MEDILKSLTKNGDCFVKSFEDISQAHTVAFWTFTFHRKQGCVQ